MQAGIPNRWYPDVKSGQEPHESRPKRRDRNLVNSSGDRKVGTKGGFMKTLTTRELVLSAALASISAAVQLVHIGYQSPQWGMWIDVVAVTWIAAFFLFGIRSSIVVSLLGALIITLFAPDTWLGAVMKFTATFPMWLSLFFYLKARKEKISFYKNIKNLFFPVLLGVVVRSILIIPINYYFAIPIWTGMTTAQAIISIPWYIIAFFNIIQGILDVGFAWVIVFRFKIARFASWYE